MLCLVKLPNSVVLEIDLDFKSKGQECLDRVCEMLGIIEVDYFGLQYFGPHAELLWLNLRNPVKQQLSGSSPIRLLFKVKFHVPPHLLLQESTRNQFFLNLVSDVRDNRIRVADRDLLIKLVALIAQSELQDWDSHSATSLKLGYRKWLPVPDVRSAQSEGLGIRASSSRVRDRRRKHFSGPSSHSDHETEEEDASSNVLSSSAPSPPLPPVPHNHINCSSDTSDHEMESSASNSQDGDALCEAVMQQHKQLKGIRSCTAKYLFVKEVSDLQDFGVEYFSVRRNSTDELFRLGVGPKGVSVSPISASIDGSPDATEEHKNSISYSSIHIATHSGRCLYLTYLTESGASEPLGFKCENAVAANAIYRAVTEKHAFYSCETVRNAVTSQFIRDLKGTIVSLFNENTPLGKNFVFDIRRTCREVYDHTRRRLYRRDGGPDDEIGCEMEEHGCIHLNSKRTACEDRCSKSGCQEVMRRLESLQDSMLCRVCMDCDVSTAFFPCRHVVCCGDCSHHCTTCPICRSAVQSVERIYLPVSAESENHLL